MGFFYPLIINTLTLPYMDIATIERHCRRNPMLLVLKCLLLFPTIESLSKDIPLQPRGSRKKRRKFDSSACQCWKRRKRIHLSLGKAIRQATNSTKRFRRSPRSRRYFFRRNTLLCFCFHFFPRVLCHQIRAQVPVDGAKSY